MECLLDDKMDSGQRHISMSKRSVLTIDNTEHNLFSHFSRLNFESKTTRDYKRKHISVIQRIHSLSVPLLSNFLE